MKSYIITIIGATILSALASIISPEKWRGYVRIITGLVIISCIISPIVSLVHSDIFAGFDDSFEAVTQGEDMQRRIVTDELEKRINADIEERLRQEFNITVTADCDIAVNADGGVEGVREIRIYGDKLSERAINRLCEVYGIHPGEVHDE